MILIIAIDGPAASGKGTLAKRIAAHFGLAWLDTGLLYRAVARDVLASGGDLEDVAAAEAAARAVVADTLADPALRGPRAGDAASIVAKIPGVRAALLDYQRHLHGGTAARCSTAAISGPWSVPMRLLKFSLRLRTKRGRNDVSWSIRRAARALRTKTCSTISGGATPATAVARPAPMHAAADALHLDTTELDAEQAFQAALQLIGRR